MKNRNVLQKMADFNGAVIIQGYDKGEQVRKAVTPDSGVVEMEYGQMQNMVKWIDPTGAEFHYAYSFDERGTVYLIFRNERLEYKKYRCNTAFVYVGYEGEEEEIFLIYDSGIFIRDDYRYIEAKLNIDRE